MTSIETSQGASSTPATRSSFPFQIQQRRVETAVKGKTHKIIIVLIIQEILLAEEVAESRIAKSNGFVRAELEHADYVGGGEFHACDLET